MFAHMYKDSRDIYIYIYMIVMTTKNKKGRTMTQMKVNNKKRGIK
jgi:hypothetical protein